MTHLSVQEVSECRTFGAAGPVPRRAVGESLHASAAAIWAEHRIGDICEWLVSCACGPVELVQL